MAADLNSLSKSLEDAFFAAEEKKMREKLQEMKKMEETKSALSKASGIKNEAVLTKLIHLNIHPEIVSSLSLIPLVEVAWADGKVEPNEKAAILKAAEANGIKAGDPDHDMLEAWLSKKPTSKLMSVWVDYVKGLCESLSADEVKQFRETLVGGARTVAEAHGGFLGLGNKISDSEAKVLQKLESAFS